MTGILIEIQPWDPITQNRTMVRLGSSSNPLTLSMGGEDWQSAIQSRPRLVQEILDDDITGNVLIGRSDFSIKVSSLQGIANADQLIWPGSPVQIWSGDGARWSDMRVEFKGSVRGGVMNRETTIVPITAEVDQKLIDIPLLNREFGGGGGLDGDVEMRGQFRPAGFGKPVNISVMFFDSVNNVGQIDGYGNTISVESLFEDLADFGPSIGDFPTYAALIAATIKPGSWGTCIADGLIRLGAPPDGAITCDATFGYGTPGTMAQRWMTFHAGVTVGRIDAADFAAMDAAANALCGEACTVEFHTATQQNVLQLIQVLCASCNHMPVLKLNGQIGVTNAFGGATVMTLDRKGGDPLVTAWATLDPTRPWWRMKMAAAKTYRTHQTNEIDFDSNIEDMGDYDPAETYRLGHVVRLPSDGRRYLFVSTTPVSGKLPPFPGYWEIYEEAPTAETVRYVDGTPIEVLKPASIGATNNFTWIQENAPSYASSVEGQRWIDDTVPGRQHEFMRTDGYLSIGGEVITIGGMPIVIVWIDVGDHKADNTSENQVLIDVIEEHTINCDENGDPISGALPYRIPVRVSKGGATITRDNNVTFRIDVESNLQSTIDNVPGSTTKGQVVINGVDVLTGAYTNVVVSIDGVDVLPVRQIRVSKVRAKVPVTGGTGSKRADVQALAAFSSTAYVVVTPVSTMTVAAADRMIVTAQIQYEVVSESSSAGFVIGVNEYRLLPAGAWTGFSGGAVNGTVSYPGEFGDVNWGYIETSPGIVDMSQIQTGLAAGDYEYRMRLRADTNGVDLSAYGDVTIEVKP